MAVGTSPRAKRMLVQYWSGSAWTNLADSSGLSRVLNLSITDSLDNPRMTTITLFNPRTSSSSIFQTGDFDTVIKNKMKIRLVDQTTFTILFLGQVENIVPENTLKGYTLTITAYDSLIELTQNILKKDSLNDGDRSNSPAVLNNDFVSEDIDELIDYGSYNQGTGNRSIEVVNTTDSDDAGAHRFQKSLGKTNTRDKDFSDSGANFLNTVKRLAELESGIEATASAKITGGLKPYNFYVDTNFQTTATDTEGSGNFFNYFPSGCMPAAAQSGTSYTLANPADDGLTLMFGTGGSITETGQTLKLLPSFSFEDLARERVTHLTAHFIDPISGYSKDVEFEVFNYKSISSGAGLQDSYEPSGTDTGGTETGKILSQVGNSVFDAASGGNLVGHLQYISNVSGAGFALLTGTTGTAGAIRHTVAAGETLHVRNAGASVIGTFTLSDTTDPNGSDIFRPQEVFKQKILKNFSINTGDLVTFRRAVAAAFENKDTRRVRGSFSLASGYPYHFVEGQVNSVSTNTITDSTIANQHATTTDGLAAANIDSFPTAGIRTGMVLHKLTGVGGTMAEYGYIEKTEDNSLTADLTNSATFSTNDYYRTYIPLRAGHTVQIKNIAINASLFNHVVTSITYEESEQGFITYLETVGDISNPKALTAGVRNKASTAPIKYDDETYSDSVPLANHNPVFTGQFKPGDTSDNNLNTAIQYTAGTFSVDGFDHTITAGDSEDATHGVDGGADHSGTAFADSTQYTIFFDPALSTTKFQIRSDADFKKQAETVAGGSGNASSAFQGDLIRLGTANKASHAAAEAPFELTNLETPNSNFKLDAQSISVNSITASLIKADTITASEIAADTITAAEIVADTLSATEIAADAITSKHTITGATIQTSSSAGADRIILNSTGIDVISSSSSSNVLDILHRSGSDTPTGIGSIYADAGQWNLASFDGTTRTSVIQIAKRGTTIGDNSAVLFIDGIVEFDDKVFVQTSIVAENVNATIGDASDPFKNVYLLPGSSAQPSFSFGTDIDTGMYRVAANQLGLAGGGLAATLNQSGIFLGPGGGFSGAYSWNNDGNTFISNPSADRIDINTGGAVRIIVTDAGMFNYSGSSLIFQTTVNGIIMSSTNSTGPVPVQFYAGRNTTYDMSNPPYSFALDTDTGMFDDASDQLSFAVGGAKCMTIDEASAVRVGIGYSTSIGTALFESGFALKVDGETKKTSSGGDWDSTSDDRIKTNVSNITNATTTLKNLDPVSYNWKSEWQEAVIGAESHTIHGFLASDYEDVFPNDTKTGALDLIELADGTHITAEEVPDGGTVVYENIKSINMGSLKAFLVAAIKELDARLTSLEGG